VIPIVLRGLAILAFVSCSLSAPQQAQFADFEGCADHRHVGYREMRQQVVAIMLQLNLDLAETVTGLEVMEEIRSGRDVRLSSADADFIDRIELLHLSWNGSPMGQTWIAALRRCLEDRHGYKIRRIEIR
jgi:hypothetical protein